MSIFICWSGARGKTIADAVAQLLQDELSMNAGDIFVSGRLEKGVEWFESIIRQLHRATVGVVCLTRENLESPWLHFEAGALASRLAPQVVGGKLPTRRVLRRQTETTVGSSRSCMACRSRSSKGRSARTRRQPTASAT